MNEQRKSAEPPRPHQGSRHQGIEDENADQPEGHAGDPTAGGSEIKKKNTAPVSHENVNRDERGRTNQKSGPRPG